MTEALPYCVMEGTNVENHDMTLLHLFVWIVSVSRLVGVLSPFVILGLISGSFSECAEIFLWLVFSALSGTTTKPRERIRSKFTIFRFGELRHCAPSTDWPTHIPEVII
jgi:hypothetical protein